MKLLIISIVFCIVGLNIGCALGGAEIWSIVFGAIGLLGPSIITIEKIYKEIKIKQDE
jgi:hypothetical protein